MTYNARCPDCGEWFDSFYAAEEHANRDLCQPPTVRIKDERQWRIMDEDDDLALVTVTAHHPSARVLVEWRLVDRNEAARYTVAAVDQAEADAKQWVNDQAATGGPGPG